MPQASPRRPSFRRPPAEFGPAPFQPAPGASREYLRLLFSRAAELVGGGHDREVRDFLVSVYQLSDLLRAFRNSPRGKIGGPRGVAAQLKVSRNAVYVWLDSFGLNPADLRSAPDVTELVHKSPALRGALEKLLPQGLTCRQGGAV